MDGAGRPVAGAVVRYQGTAVATKTSDDGTFTLPPPPPGVRAITAWRRGHLNGGAPLGPEGGSHRIVLVEPPAGDDPRYAWARARPADPADGRKTCDRCHPEIVEEWERSAHATSAVNPLFLAVYEGKDRRGRATGAPAYRRDFPGAPGNCATCHVPALALGAPFDADPVRARGAAADGIGCDLCHKIADATLDPTGGRPGVLSLRFARPPPGKDVFFGQLDDVIAGPDGAHPLYRRSLYCAPCHHGTFWKVRVYPEFEEWAASAYARRGVECQDCHMPSRGGPRRIAPEAEGGVLRDAATLSSHLQLGLNDPALMRGAVRLRTAGAAAGGRLRVLADLANVAAGHHVPTGSAMRNMLLRIDARDAAGVPLRLADGERLPEWAGRGGAPADWAGLPGRAYARVLADLVEYPADRRQGRRFERAMPAPHWRPAIVVSDTRIAAETADAAEWEFDLGGARPPVTVRATVVYRRTFRSWGTLHRVKDDDLTLAEQRLEIVW